MKKKQIRDKRTKEQMEEAQRAEKYKIQGHRKGGFDQENDPRIDF